MPSTINASASSGLITTADTSTILQLQTGGTTAVTVDASQNVGIGTASPGTKLTVDGTVRSTTIQAVNSVSSINQFVSMTVDSVGTNINSSFITSGNAHLLFSTSSTERMRVLGSAPILCLAGGSTTATGTGIAFPATQSASSNANTLDDYEEGTWTPALGGTWTSNPTGLGGYYTKIGRFVTAYLEFVGGTKTSSISGYFTGLPFNTDIHGTGSATDSNVTNNGLALAANANRIWLTGTSFGSTNYVVVNYMTST